MWSFNDERTRHLRGTFTTRQMKAFSDILTITADTLVREDSGPWLPFSQVQHLLSNTNRDVQGTPRLSIDEIPPNEYQLCDKCPEWKGCDLTLLWDRKYAMWVTWDEYELLIKADLQHTEPTVNIEPSHEDEDAAVELLNKEVKKAKRKAYQERKKAKKLKPISSSSLVVYLSGIPADAQISSILDFCTINNTNPIDCKLSAKTGDAWLTFETSEKATEAAAVLDMKEVIPDCKVSAQVADRHDTPLEPVHVGNNWDSFLDEQSSDDEFQIKTS